VNTYDAGFLFLIGSTGLVFAFGTVNYSVTFAEVGLPVGTSWSVTLGGATQTTTSPTVSFSEPDGTYSFSVGAVPGFTAFPASGSLTVNGAPVNETVAFTPVSPTTYPVVFTQTGLLSGTSWSVTLAGATQISTASTISFTEPNGTYSYSVQDVPGWHQTTLPYSGLVAVSGSSVTEVTLEFVQVTYLVSFVETGMPPAAGGGVSLNGGPISAFATGGVLTFDAPNGTYYYQVTAGSGYQLTVSSPDSPVTVTGSSATVTLTFEAIYTLTFTEAGLPSGTVWYLNVSGGLSLSSTMATITFTEPNGTYSFTVGSLTGYTPSPQSGSITVNGRAPSATSVTFVSSASSSSPGSGLSSLTYVIIGVVIAVVAIVAVVLLLRHSHKPPKRTHRALV